MATPSSTLTEVRLLQSLKAFSPIISTVPGILAVVRLPQDAKADAPISVTPLGTVIEVRPQPEKAQIPMLVIPSSILTEVRLLQSLKAYSPRVSTLPGILAVVRL